MRSTSWPSDFEEFICLQRQAAELLFQLLASRHEVGSLAVTSNLDLRLMLS